MTAPGIQSAAGSRVLRAIVWKEFREAAPTGVAALAIVALGWALVLMLERSLSGAGAASTAPSFSLSLFTLTSAGVGLMIGRAQVVRERRGDAWAFLTHRPVSRSTLFWGKVIVGASLYIVAAAIPLAAALWWQATPGHRPLPFDARMILPHLADLLAGLVYYFVGLVIGMREARWYASRFMPFGAAIFCTTLVLGMSTFGAALGVVAAALLIAGTAAWGSFIGGGHYAPQPRISRVALGILVSVGLAVVGVIATGILSIAWTFGRPGATDLRQTDYEIMSNGVLAQVTRMRHLLVATSTVLDVRDLAGAPLQQYRDSASKQLSLGTGVISTAAIPLNPKGQYTEYVLGHGYRRTDDIFVPLGAGAKTPSAVSWYFSRRPGLIAAYDNQSARLIGWMGPDGFSPGVSLPPHRFAGPLSPYTEIGYKQPLLAFPNAVYRLDLDQRTIRKVRTALTGETILGAASSGDSTALSVYGSPAQFDAIATTTHVYVQSTAGAPELTATRDAQAAGYGTVVVSRALRAPGTPTFLRYAPRNGTLSRTQLAIATDRFTEIGGDGVTVAQYALPRSDSTDTDNTEWAALTVAGLTTPLMERIVGLSFGHMTVPTGASTQASRAPLILSWGLTLVASLVSCLIVIGIGRRYAFDSRRLRHWAAIGIAVGPLGVLVMLALIEWPARERCPACGRERVVTREQCEHCGAPFGAPALDGTEIFEIAVVAVA